jgi:hypothetical protein
MARISPKRHQRAMYGGIRQNVVAILGADCDKYDGISPAKAGLILRWEFS